MPASKCNSPRLVGNTTSREHKKISDYFSWHRTELIHITHFHSVAWSSLFAWQKLIGKILAKCCHANVVQHSHDSYAWQFRNRDHTNTEPVQFQELRLSSDVWRDGPQRRGIEAAGWGCGWGSGWHDEGCSMSTCYCCCDHEGHCESQGRGGRGGRVG